MNNLCGKIIALRPLRMDDADVLCSWKNDENTYMYLGGGFQPTSVDQYKKWLEGMIDQSGANRRFIIESENRKPLGMVGLYGINWIHRTCEVGLFIGESDSKHSGVGSEAYSLMESYAKDYLNLRKITLKVVEENSSSVAFWLKQGFEQVGKLREERFIGGHYCDLIIMEKFLSKS